MNATIGAVGASSAAQRGLRWNDEADAVASRRGTVWLANAPPDVAVDVASRLIGLDLDVRVWQPGTVLAIARHDGGTAATASRPQRPLEQLEPAARSTCRGGLAPGALRKVREAIDAQLAEPITLIELARLAEVSTCHFARAFKQSMGIPPHRYIVERRIAVASNLVAQTKRPFIDIALAVGFSDHSHFTRMFVRVTGETPRACRRRQR